MKKLITQITMATTILASSFSPVFAKGVSTPYEHIPVDTFIAGFPFEPFVIIGITSYFLGIVYIFTAVFLKSASK